MISHVNEYLTRLRGSNRAQAEMWCETVTGGLKFLSLGTD